MSRLSLASTGCLLLVIVTTGAVHIKDCGSSADLNVNDIQITGCEGRRNCLFKKGQYANLTIPFETKLGFNTLEAEVHGIIGGVPVPFKLDHPQACGRSISCPAAPGADIRYTESMMVKRFYPSMTLRVKWALMDDKHQRQVCIIFPVQLK